MFVGGADGELHAVSANYGTSKWSYIRPRLHLNGRWQMRAKRPIVSSAALSPEGIVYVGADTALVALNAATGSGGFAGTVKWSYETRGLVLASPALDDLGRIYVGSMDGSMYALVRENGAYLWRFDAEGGSTPPRPWTGAGGCTSGVSTGTSTPSTPPRGRSRGNSGRAPPCTAARRRAGRRRTTRLSSSSSPRDRPRGRRRIARGSWCTWGARIGNCTRCAPRTGRWRGTRRFGTPTAPNTEGERTTPPTTPPATPPTTPPPPPRPRRTFPRRSAPSARRRRSWRRRGCARRTWSRARARETSFRFGWNIRLECARDEGAVGVVASPVLSPNGLVYVGSGDGYFYAVRNLTGKVAWTMRADGAVQSSAAVDESGGCTSPRTTAPCTRSSRMPAVVARGSFGERGSNTWSDACSRLEYRVAVRVVGEKRLP